MKCSLPKIHQNMPTYTKICQQVTNEIPAVQNSDVVSELIQNIIDDVSKITNKTECSFCGKLYQRPHMLKKHIDTYHAKETNVCKFPLSITVLNNTTEENTEASLETAEKVSNEQVQDSSELSTNQNVEKETLENELRQKVKEVEMKSKEDLKKCQNVIIVFQNKIKILENTTKKYEAELDKQVQLKEKFAEENKTLRNIIKNHIELKDLKIELQNVLSVENLREVNDENGEILDEEWEDISEETEENDGFVKVVNKRKKKLLKHQFKEVSCKNRGQRFNKNRKLKKHLDKHTAESKHTCNVCSIPFNSEHDLKNHVSINHKEPLKEHETIDKAKSKYHCEKCNINLETEQGLTDHKSTSHGSIIPIKCRLCEFHTLSQTNFLLHMESHNREQNKINCKPVKSTCRWFLRGSCRFGNKCWNSHTEPPQCIFKSKCRDWPNCHYGHYEVCERFNECRNQNCLLEHPSKPFLGPVRTQKPPNIHSIQEFPKLRRSPRGW